VADVTVIETRPAQLLKQELFKKYAKLNYNILKYQQKISIVDNIIGEPTVKVNRKLQNMVIPVIVTGASRG